MNHGKSPKFHHCYPSPPPLPWEVAALRLVASANSAARPGKKGLAKCRWKRDERTRMNLQKHHGKLDLPTKTVDLDGFSWIFAILLGKKTMGFQHERWEFELQQMRFRWHTWWFHQWRGIEMGRNETRWDHSEIHGIGTSHGPRSACSAALLERLGPLRLQFDTPCHLCEKANLWCQFRSTIDSF